MTPWIVADYSPGLSTQWILARISRIHNLIEAKHNLVVSSFTATRNFTFKTESHYFAFNWVICKTNIHLNITYSWTFLLFNWQVMAHLSPPPSPPSTLPSVASKLLNYPNIMNGLDKLNFPLASSALRANLNTALQNKLSQGKPPIAKYFNAHFLADHRQKQTEHWCNAFSCCTLQNQVEHVHPLRNVWIPVWNNNSKHMASMLKSNKLKRFKNNVTTSNGKCICSSMLESMN